MSQPINEMPTSVTIKQIMTAGQYNKEIIGLGDDNLLYEWVKSKGKWKQYFEVSRL